MANLKIMTKGMHCTSCEMLIKDALEDMDGINKVEAFHKNGEVNVDFDENKIDPDKIKIVIKQEGYEC